MAVIINTILSLKKIRQISKSKSHCFPETNTYKSCFIQIFGRWRIYVKQNKLLTLEQHVLIQHLRFLISVEFFNWKLLDFMKLKNKIDMLKGNILRYESTKINFQNVLFLFSSLILCVFGVYIEFLISRDFKIVWWDHEVLNRFLR